MIEERQLALPKLYGAPSYRPPRPAVEPVARPFDPDDLPLTAELTREEQEFVAALPDQAFAPGGGVILDGRSRSAADDDAPGDRRGLRGLAGRFRGRN